MGLMIWEWEVILDRSQGNPLVPYQVYISKGESADEVRDAWKDLGEVKTVRPLRPWLDPKRAQTYAEGCYYIGRQPTGEMISELQAKGLFPKPVDGRPKPIPRRMLDDYLFGLWGSRPPDMAA